MVEIMELQVTSYKLRVTSYKLRVTMPRVAMPRNPSDILFIVQTISILLLLGGGVPQRGEVVGKQGNTYEPYK